MIFMKKIDKVFEKIVGHRFSEYQEIEQWFKTELGDKAKDVVVTGCYGINDEIKNGKSNVDYSTDCSFGENIFGMDYADFTLYYVLDNAGRMLITEAGWN